MSYQIFTDATCDMSEEMLVGLPNVEIIPMEVVIGETSYTYGPKGNLTIKEFYDMQRGGAFASTSQISPEIYREAFEPFLKNGQDVIYLAFSSGLSGTINSANLCARDLEEDYPERKIICIDTLCASSGLGFFVREAARKQAEGLNIVELTEWVMEHRLNVCHWFAVDTFEHLRHGGRVSNAAAVAGSVLNIKPLLHVDEEGRLKVAEKPRGHKQALKIKLAKLKDGWTPELGKFVLVAHGDCPERAAELKNKIKEQHPDAEVCTAEIGPVVGAHTGPGMLAVLYWGSNR